MQYMGSEYAPPVFPPTPPRLTPPPSFSSGYLQPCYDIVTCARHIANPITVSIPELYVLGSFAPRLDRRLRLIRRVGEHEVGDRMSKKGWHLNALSGPAAVLHAVGVASRGHVYFESQGVCGASEECAGGQRRWLRCTVSLCRLLVPPRTPR